MDGGGRFSESLNAPAASGRARLTRLRLPRVLRRFTAARRLRPAVPIEARVPRHLGTPLLAGTLAVVALSGFVASGRYDAFVAENGRPLDVLARLAGFGVEKVTISGISRMYEREVLHAAGIDWRTSVPFLDVEAARQRLLAEPLIASASVRKVYPNEIVITQVEREPAALWQRNGEIQVIAADGTVIDEMRDDRYASLPLVVGENANVHLKEYLSLIEAAGPLGERVKAGTYVSGRRWTLKLDGVDIRLPEDDPVGALGRLADLERKNRLLEKDIIAVDLRMPDRVVVRLTEEAAAARAESQKKTKKGTAT
ncbi:FtsQ-type POTRA domain-containing protein [Methylobacterium organophilum]|uniref:cell division protein FtsQ/DivIB n=1 Tax=Methylobacterium organophilum TaxID=410 RepID=UPI001F13E972|nr:cell division protein FtsQ/DivIB [Methylobacterium organophilum]UMY19783.1 FtsQ-type POTRA domain-containing protein [Methylobacterium organophilum]